MRSVSKNHKTFTQKKKKIFGLFFGDYLHVIYCLGQTDVIISLSMSGKSNETKEKLILRRTSAKNVAQIRKTMFSGTSFSSNWNMGVWGEYFLWIENVHERRFSSDASYDKGSTCSENTRIFGIFDCEIEVREIESLRDKLSFLSPIF